MVSGFLNWLSEWCSGGLRVFIAFCVSFWRLKGVTDDLRVRGR